MGTFSFSQDLLPLLEYCSEFYETSMVWTLKKPVQASALLYTVLSRRCRSLSWKDFVIIHHCCLPWTPRTTYSFYQFSLLQRYIDLATPSVPAVFLDIAASVSKLVWSHVVVLQLLNANATLGLNLSSWKMYLYISGSASRTMSGQNIVNGLVLLFVIFYSTRALKALWTTCLVNPFTSRHTSTKNNQKTWITSTQFLFTFCEFHLYLFFSVSPARIKK